MQALSWLNRNYRDADLQRAVGALLQIDQESHSTTYQVCLRQSFPYLSPAGNWSRRRCVQQHIAHYGKDCRGRQLHAGSLCPAETIVAPRIITFEGPGINAQFRASRPVDRLIVRNILRDISASGVAPPTCDR